MLKRHKNVSVFNASVDKKRKIYFFCFYTRMHSVYPHFPRPVFVSVASSQAHSLESAHRGSPRTDFLSACTLIV